MFLPDQNTGGLDALLQERAFVDLSSYRKVRAEGSDARRWLNDLATADIATLTRGQSRRSLLLSPTGHVRADFHVASVPESQEAFVLLQAADQPEHVGLILSRYVLSADVALHDMTTQLALFSVPGRAADLVGHPGLAPSVLGPGIDLLPPTGKPAWRLEAALVKAGLEEAQAGACEAWRIRQGSPRMGPDFDQTCLPAEAGLESVIDWEKGCFPGQESAAKVRSLGHPPTILLHVLCEGQLDAGEPVYSGAERVGRVTSACVEGGRTYALVRVRWRHAPAPLGLADGRSLVQVAKAA